MEEQKEPLSEEQLQEDLEISHTDKLVGVFTEPGRTFEKMSVLPRKASDWLLPIILVIVVSILSNVLMMTNPIIKHDFIEQRMEETKTQLDGMVEDGTLSEQQAEQQLAQQRGFFENDVLRTIMTAVGTAVFIFVFFFLLALIYYIIAKSFIKGTGNYKDAMIAYGLPNYIFVLQLIIITILALATDKLYNSTSIAAFTMSLEEIRTTFGGFILSKIDPFTIWFYGIVSVGLAKMFKSKSAAPYFIWVYGTWIVWHVLIFFLAQQVGFFKNFIM